MQNSLEKVDLEKTSFFAILGLTGTGKSTFINAISNSSYCKVSNKGKSETQTPQLIAFADNKLKHFFRILDTPGLGDSKDNDAIINKINQILISYPYIKKIVILKPYSDLRLADYLQNAIKVMMDSFPLKNFWDHVIIVNNRCVPTDFAYQDFLEEHPESFLDKLKQCYNLRQYMKQKHIDFPKEIKEFHVDSKRKDKFPEIQKEFDNILKNIKETKMMFKKIETKPLKREEKDGKEEGIIIKIEYIPIECTDFMNKITTIRSNYKESSEVKEEYKDQLIKIKEEHKEEYIGDVEPEWFDILSLGISYLIRPTSQYKVYDLTTFKYIKSGKTITERTNETIEIR